MQIAIIVIGIVFVILVLQEISMYRTRHSSEEMARALIDISCVGGTVSNVKFFSAPCGCKREWCRLHVDAMTPLPAPVHDGTVQS